MSFFLDACGATGPMQWTVACRDSAVVECLTFDQPFLVVGSNPASDLHLPHPEVSDRHAYLQLIGGRLIAWIWKPATASTSTDAADASGGSSEGNDPDRPLPTPAGQWGS